MLKRILIVDDEPAIRDMVAFALRKDNYEPVHAGDAREAQEAIAQKVPDLILLDLNLPRMDGREVLQHIKTQPQLRRIPVVILTTSKAEEDILRSYDLYANCYVTKSPVDFDNFIEVIRSIDRFWLALVTLPPKADD